jgi:hypothetical protein
MEKGPSALLIGPRKINHAFERKPRLFPSSIHYCRVVRFRAICFIAFLETLFAKWVEYCNTFVQRDFPKLVNRPRYHRVNSCLHFDWAPFRTGRIFGVEKPFGNWAYNVQSTWQIPHSNICLDPRYRLAKPVILPRVLRTYPIRVSPLLMALFAPLFRWDSIYFNSLAALGYPRPRHRTLHSRESRLVLLV